MAAPIASSLTLPDDSSNVGKKFRTETRVVGGVTVHENFVVPVQAMTITGKYFFSSPQQSVVQSVHNGTSTAFFWFQMPTAATVTAQIRFISVDCNVSSALAAPTSPLIGFTKFTFTGTASGSTLPALPAQTSMPTNQMICRTAITGMTPSLVTDFASYSIPTLVTAVGQFFGTEIVYEHSPISYVRGMDVEFGPGEGIAVWQEQAGTASDPRKFAVQMEWIEMDLS